MSESVVHAVLVVDDNAGNRALAKATLEDEGIHALLAEDAEQGIAAFTAHRPDCVLLDIRMPGTDGIAACERIRALPGGDHVAIVFVTAHRDVETFDRARRAGGDDFVTKPFRPGELIVRIQTALRLRRMAAERGELADQLRRQRDELMRLQLQKEQLAGFLVHDLKNPVQAIELLAQRVLRGVGSDARAKDAAARIHDETRALMRMITNLLDITRADEGQLAPARSELDLPSLVASVIDELQSRASAAEVELVAAIATPALQADPDLVRRVIANLVDNAIRHAPERTAVRIAIDRDGAGTRLQVIDEGPGIPADQRDRVFDRFVSGAAPGAGNRGLGLAFCKLAVEAHGGRIWVEDAAAPGTVFCAWFPDAA
jgi:two-component system sensor histidine kinase/response regulator